eukprot:COSAG03_NODE_10400_length_653_cov_0.850181_1_plen_66_part_00
MAILEVRHEGADVQQISSQIIGDRPARPVNLRAVLVHQRCKHRHELFPNKWPRVFAAFCLCLEYI